MKKSFKNIAVIIAVILFSFGHLIVFAQNETDSLWVKLQSTPEQEKPEILNRLAEANNENASNKAIQFAETALEISQKYNDRKNEALAFQNLCLGYLYNDIYDKALVNGLAALDIFEQLDNPKDLAYILSTLGWLYYDIQNADVALNYHQKVLDLYLQLDDKDNIAYSYNSLGLVYSMKEEYEEALTYYLKSLKTAETYELKIREAAACSNLGMTYSSLKIYDLALSYLQKSMDLRTNNSSVLQIAEVWNQIGRVYLHTKQFDQAASSLEKASALIAQSTSNSSREKLMDNYEYSAELYAEKGDYQKAFEAHKDYSNIRNTILSDDKTNRLLGIRLLYETEKKEGEIKLLESQKKTDRIILIASIIGFLLFLTIGYLTYSKLKNTQLQERLISENLKDKLDFKNNELTTFALHIAQRNELLTKFVEALSIIQKDAKEGTAKQLMKLVQRVEQSRTVNKDLESFHFNVENEYKDFFYNLNKKYPNLTENEKRLAAQLRLNLSNKDIAALNNISLKSVEMARYRLRKKLELDSKANLFEFFKKF